MAALGPLNRWLILRGRFRIAHFDLPDADRARLSKAVNPATAAFLTPNHPEFGLDWMLDKEISTMVAPLMAAWASQEIVDSARWFWTRNNLVAHRGGAEAFEYSIKWALAGNATLLHPEGTVRWTGDVVHPLFPGAAEMAVEAAHRAAVSRSGRPIYVVPLIWRIRYLGDVAAGMHADMAHIERALGLARGDRTNVAERFRQLQEATLARQAVRFGFDLDSLRYATWDFFARQEAFRTWLVRDLIARHPVAPSESIDRLIGRLARAVTTAEDRARVREAERLGGFVRAIYDGATLTQEHIHESLKRLRADLVRRGLQNTLHNFLPKPYGARAVHIRVPEPIAVEAPRTDDPDARAEQVAWLLSELRGRMQSAIDEVDVEIAPAVDAFRRPNPFVGR